MSGRNSKNFKYSFIQSKPLSPEKTSAPSVHRETRQGGRRQDKTGQLVLKHSKNQHQSKSNQANI